MSFLNEDFFKGTDWRAVERCVARCMSHCGWHSVRVVGNTGDGGGDVIGVRKTGAKESVYVVQVKALMGGDYVGKDAIQEAIDALTIYGGDIAVVATNGDFTQKAYERRDQLIKAGFNVRLWNGAFHRDLLEKWPEQHFDRVLKLRQYQEDVVQSCVEKYNSGKTQCQFVVATGLGKTIIAAEVLSHILKEEPMRVLVLCHQRDLALQLEQAFWRQINKSIPTRVFFDGVPPKPIYGINFGLYQTFHSYISGVSPETYDVVIVDEAHHALAHGFRRCVSHLKPRFLIGMTATPWRGDGTNINDVFGLPVAQVSLVDGMQMGYLAKVDYRIFCDTINWHDVPTLTKGNMTIKDLNKRLFIPQRDEAIISQIANICKDVKKPRIIVFCASIEHCKRFSNLFSTITKLTCKPLSGIDKRDRYKALMEFSSGKIPAVAAVDVLNEGIDVPDINIIVFLRATHSRRIFVQQLGRGLRISDKKDTVIVADFVTDIRRIAEVMDMDSASRVPQSPYCVLNFDKGIVTFQNDGVRTFVEQWLHDVSELKDADDTHELSFPEVL